MVTEEENVPDFGYLSLPNRLGMQFDVEDGPRSFHGIPDPKRRLAHVPGTVYGSQESSLGFYRNRRGLGVGVE